MTLSTITRQPTCTECGCRIYDEVASCVEAFEASMCPTCFAWDQQCKGEAEDAAKFETYWEGVGE